MSTEEWILTFKVIGLKWTPMKLYIILSLLSNRRGILLLLTKHDITSSYCWATTLLHSQTWFRSCSSVVHKLFFITVSFLQQYPIRRQYAVFRVHTSMVVSRWILLSMMFSTVGGRVRWGCWKLGSVSFVGSSTSYPILRRIFLLVAPCSATMLLTTTFILLDLTLYYILLE